MELGLAGRVALVTGGGRGIGRAIALRLAHEGAKVAVLGRQEATLEETCRRVAEDGGEAMALVADLAEPASIAAAVERMSERFGAVEVLVHNAARFSRRARLAQYGPEDWAASLAVNVQGVSHLNSLVLPGMRRRGWGRVVFIGSMVGAGGSRGNGLYAAVKSTQEALARGIALDYGPFGITANLVAPGFIDTERLREISTESIASEHAAGAALRRLGTPEEVANAVVFLASEAASFVTGVTLPVGGGAHLNNRW